MGWLKMILNNHFLSLSNDTHKDIANDTHKDNVNGPLWMGLPVFKQASGIKQQASGSKQSEIKSANNTLQIWLINRKQS